MAVFEDTPEPIAKPVVPDDRGRPHSSIVADSRTVKFEALSTHVAGFKWTVTYYRQYLGLDDETAALDTDVAGAFQQYLKINSMEFRVTDPLTPAQDGTSREFTYTGSANIYAGLIPNVGDHFIADVGDGRLGLFNVIEVEQASITKNSIYVIQYDMMEFLSEERRIDLESKVVKVTHFVKDFVNLGRNPLLIQSEYNQYTQVLTYVNTLPLEFFHQFYDDEYRTFLIPDQPYTTYDPHIVSTMRLMAPDSAYNLFSRIEQHNIQSKEDWNRTTLWDVIRNRDERGLDLVSNEMRPSSVNYYKWAHYFGGIHYTGIDRVMMPAGSTIAIDFGEELTPSAEVVYSRPKTPTNPNPNLTGIPLDANGTPPPLIKLVTADKFYGLSQAFYYQEVENMSVLEYLLTQHILGKTVSISVLLTLCENSAEWGKVEKFYYLPILLVLLNHAYLEIN